MNTAKDQKRGKIQQVSDQALSPVKGYCEKRLQASIQTEETSEVSVCADNVLPILSGSDARSVRYR